MTFAFQTDEFQSIGHKHDIEGSYHIQQKSTVSHAERIVQLLSFVTLHAEALVEMPRS